VSVTYSRRVIAPVIRCLLVLAAVLTLALPAAAAPGRLSILGRWKGTLHQRNVRPFVVTATIRGFDALSLNTVRYTGIDCSGHWTYLTRKGRSYEFREVITSGAGGKCKSAGRVAFTQVSANRANYVFRGEGVVSRGALRRR
jgi:hypothetical protein